MDDTTSDDPAPDDGSGTDPVLERAIGKLNRVDQLRKEEELLCDGHPVNVEERADEVVADLDEVIASLRDDQRPEALRLVISALSKKPDALHRLQHVSDEDLIALYDEVVVVYDQLVATTGLTSCLDVLGTVLEQLRDKAGVLRHGVKDMRAAQRVVLELVTRYEQTAAAVGDPALAAGRDVAIAAMSTDFGPWSHLRDLDLAYCRELLDRVRSELRSQAQNCVGQGMLYKALFLGSDDRREEQIEVYGEIVALIGDAPGGGARLKVAQALEYKADVLHRDLGRTDEALAVYDEIVARFRTVEDLEVWGAGDVDDSVGDLVVRALISKGRILSDKLGRIDDALAAFDEVVVRYGGEDGDAASCAAVATALLARALVLRAVERSDEALAVYDDIVVRYDRHRAITDGDADTTAEDRPDADTVGLPSMVARALLERGEMLQEHARHE